MDLELVGKAAIITGSSRGIGKAVALELAKEGVDVAICARNSDSLNATAKEIESRISQGIAIRRIVEAREVAYLVTFLASQRAAALTGEIIAAGGGSQRAVFQ